MLTGVGFSFRILLVICKLKRIKEELLSFIMPPTLKSGGHIGFG